jgi:MFS family permease
MKAPSPFGNRRIFGILFFVVLITTMGAGIVAPLLPVYAQGLGAGNLEIGAIFASFSLGRTIFVPIFGILSDIFQKRWFIIIGLALYSVVSLLYFISTGVKGLILTRLSQGIASAMVLPVAQAYVVDLVKKEKMGTALGAFNIALYLGLSLGPILGGTLNDRYGVGASFIAMGVFTLSAMVFASIMLPSHGEFKGPLSLDYKAYFAMIRIPKVFSSVFIRFNYTASVGMLWAFLPLYAQNEVHLTSAQTGLVVMVNVLVAGLSQIPAGWLWDRVEKDLVLLLSFLVTACGLLGFLTQASFLSLFVSNGVFGLGGGMAMPALMAMVGSESKRSGMTGSGMGILSFAHGLGMLIGPIMGAWALDVFGFKGIFGSALVLTSFGVIFWMMGRSRGSYGDTP